MKFRNEKSVYARKQQILMVEWSNMFSLGNLGVWLPTGYENESRKKGKKELVNHLGVQSFDSMGKPLWDQSELEFTLGSRQSHGHIGNGMTGTCLSLCGLHSPGDWTWFGRVAGRPLVK